MWRQLVIVIVISKLLKRYSKAKRTRAPAYSRALRRIKGGFSKGRVKRSSGSISKIPGGDRVAVKVCVVQVEKVNDQTDQMASASAIAVMVVTLVVLPLGAVYH